MHLLKPKFLLGHVGIHFLIPGKFVFASLICNFRHGREEDEVMGVSFQKELVVDRIQVYPPPDKSEEKDKLQVSK